MPSFIVNLVLAAGIALLGARTLAAAKDFAFVFVFVLSVTFVGLTLLRSTLWRDYAIARRQLQLELNAARGDKEPCGMVTKGVEEQIPPAAAASAPADSARAEWVELPSEERKAV